MNLRVPITDRLSAVFTATTVVMIALVASVGVATILAWQAMTAAQQRQTVTTSMLREYARLAAWEFSREAARDIDMSVMRTLAARAHPDRHVTADQCDCEPLTEVESWFELSPEGRVVTDSPALTPVLKDQITTRTTNESGGSMEGQVQMWHVFEADRIVSVRWEPHVGTAGGQMGFVIAPRALRDVLARTYRRAVLLPSLTTDKEDARRYVDLKVLDRDGKPVFASSGTVAGAQGFEANLLANDSVGLRVSTSMTPAFVAGLGPEHGAGPGSGLVIGLVLVNGVLVGIGIWQLAREREFARLRANFVAGVSHELRTPLAQIRMFAETLLLERIRNPDEGRRALEIIGRETRRLGQLVENVLYFHRHQRVPTLDTVEEIDLVALVREVVDVFEPLATARRVRLDFQPSASAIPMRASPDGLRQVILNLLDNAVKFGPSGQVVRVTLDAHGPGARIGVEDGGPGIPNADRRRVFRPFERGRDTRGAGGAGIGLAVVQQIVDMHGGLVAIETSPTGGARLVVTLPGGAQ